MLSSLRGGGQLEWGLWAICISTISGLGVTGMRVKEVRSGWNRKWQSITVFRAVGITVPLK